MSERRVTSWMMSEAVSALARAERTRMHFFEISSSSRSAQPCWEPPVDVIETEGEILVIVALPGVDPAHVEAAVEGNSLVVRGRRVLPAELRRAVIHRLELPQGRFERRIPLPAGQFKVERKSANGCLLVSLRKPDLKVP